MSITLQAYRVLAGSSRHTYHFQYPMSSQKVQVTLQLSFCHVLKRPKVIELDIPWRASVVAYLLRALEIQTVMVSGKTRDSS